MRILWLALFAGAAAANGQVYVSPAGDDANPGTRAQQVRTLTHARDLARARKVTEVILTGGVYLSGFLKVPGVENGKAVTFTVTARNVNGVSAPSMPSLPVIPAATMAQVGAPQKASANVSNGMASIHFQGRCRSAEGRRRFWGIP